MKVIDYLQAKYKQKYPTTCLYIEAIVFGIPYPLMPAWIVRHGQNEISSDQCINLEKRLMACLGKPSKKTQWAESGLKAISRKEVIEKSAGLYYCTRIIFPRPVLCARRFYAWNRSPP